MTSSIPDNAMDKDEERRKEEIQRDAERTATALSVSETVSRFGSANAEFIKGYYGVDNEKGQKFAKGLADIAKHKVNADPKYAKQNIKQQAGYSAEVAITSRDNAESIINRVKVRASRSDDLPQYGTNHTVVDRVQIINGKIIEGSQSQMKFVGNQNQLLKKIAEDSKNADAEFSRYRGVKLELPSEQYVDAIEFCQNKAKGLQEQANKAAKKGAPAEVVERLKKNAKNYEELAENIADTGITTEDAIFYRTHPKMATAMDIVRTSHRAGIEGAGYGGVIGGAISLLANAFSVAQEKKQLSEAVLDVANDTGKAAVLGYATAFAGSSLKGALQQSGNQGMRTLARTNAPTLAVSICLSLGGSIKSYVAGEITEGQFLSEVGEKGAGILSGSMMAALGQIAIPIPVVGAAIGGMIGYTLSSFFYQSALEAANSLDLSRERLARVKEIEAAARARIAEERAAFEDFVGREVPVLIDETKIFFDRINTINEGVDFLAESINEYAALLGKNLQFETADEFNEFMLASQPLKL